MISYLFLKWRDFTLLIMRACNCLEALYCQ
jgi:hypothetical protein